MRFVDAPQLKSSHRGAFFAYASRVMRSVIIDELRQRRAERRGGGLSDVTLDTQAAELLPADEVGVMRVNEALDALSKMAPRLAQVVEMRYFGGYTEVEIAESLDVTERTVRRDWEKARLLLLALIQQ
jgi:RNA polymerase sigma factor (TIGR02999 family)